MTTVSGGKKKTGLFQELRNPERRLAYYMVLPALLIILAVAVYPIGVSVYLSLFDARINNVGEFVGIENYVSMFQNDDFRSGLTNTVIFTVVSVFIEFIIGLAIALAINRAFRGRGLVRAAVLVPWAFPTVISAVMWRLMFQDQVGIINYAATSLGVISQPILSDQYVFMMPRARNCMNSGAMIATAGKKLIASIRVITRFLKLNLSRAIA